MNHFKNLEKVLSENVNKEILNEWISNEIVVLTLAKYNIAPSFFGKFFGDRVIDYAFGIIKKEQELGNCPIINIMLDFFEKKEIPLDAVFSICVNLKNSMISYFLSKNLLTQDIFNEICFLIDSNFIGVINSFFSRQQNMVCALSFSKNTPVKTISAYEFNQDIQLEQETIDEFDEIEQETIDMLDLSTDINYEVTSEIIYLFSKYQKMIHSLFDFEDISNALLNLNNLLNNVNREIIQENSLFLKIYINAIILDLSSWRKNVFISFNTENIHYLDKSLLSSISQLEIILSPNNRNETEEIEFF